jgi:hypothetical protein
MTTKISDTARKEPDDDVWWAIRDCKELYRARQKLSINELRTIIKIVRETSLSHSTQEEPVAWQCRARVSGFEWTECEKWQYDAPQDSYEYRALYAAPPALSHSTQGAAKEMEEALKYATGLACSLAIKHYSELHQWKPLPDLIGVLTQIDNMTTGMSRSTLSHSTQGESERIAELEHAWNSAQDRIAKLEEALSHSTQGAVTDAGLIEAVTQARNILEGLPNLKGDAFTACRILTDALRAADRSA